MQHFVAALTSLPSNNNPNPKWSSLLKDLDAGKVKCGDCHTKADMSGLSQQQNSPAIEQLHANKEFMVDLMTKWVAKLNNPDFGARMRGDGPIAEEIRQLFEVSCRRAGLNKTRLDLSTSAFRRILPNQMELGF